MDEESMFEDLILSGALEVAGVDIDTGEMLYNFTEKLKDHNEFSTYFSTEISGLWENGFIEMNITEKNPMVSLTKKALDEKEVKKLDKQKQYTLKEIIRVIMNNRR
jgi:hypothetical protein